MFVRAPGLGNSITSEDGMRYHLGLFAEHMSRMAPEGADTSRWRR